MPSSDPSPDCIALLDGGHRVDLPGITVAQAEAAVDDGSASPFVRFEPTNKPPGSISIARARICAFVGRDNAANERVARR